MVTDDSKLIKWFRIEAPHFVAGGEIDNDSCSKVAPIIKYMKGWNENKIGHYARSKKWMIKFYLGV